MDRQDYDIARYRPLNKLMRRLNFVGFHANAIRRKVRSTQFSFQQHRYLARRTATQHVGNLFDDDKIRSGHSGYTCEHGNGYIAAIARLSKQQPDTTSLSVIKRSSPKLTDAINLYQIERFPAL